MTVRSLVSSSIVVVTTCALLLGTSCASLFGNSRQQTACENAEKDVETRFGKVTIHDCQLLEDAAGEERVWVEVEAINPRDVSFSSPIGDAGFRQARQVLEDILRGKVPPEKAAAEAARIAKDSTVCPSGRCPEAEIFTRLGKLSEVEPLRALSDADDRAIAIARFLYHSGRPLEAAGRLSPLMKRETPPMGVRPLFARSVGRMGDVDTAIDLLAKDAATHKETNRDLLDDLYFIGVIAQETPYIRGRRLNLAIAAWDRYLQLLPDSPQRQTVEKGLPRLKARTTAEDVDYGAIAPVRVVFEVPSDQEVGGKEGGQSRFVPLVSGESYEVRGRGEVQFLRFYAEWRGYGPAALVQERADGDIRHRLIFALTPAVERLVPRAIPLALKPRFVAQMR